MRPPQNFPLFTRALLPCVLTGFFASIINGVYMIFFRDITGFMPAIEFNFLSIPLVTMVMFIVLGLMLFVFVRYINLTAFFIAFIILIIAGVAITALLHSNPGETAFYGDHGLIAGFLIINGLLGITLLPYLYKHPHLFI